MTPNIDVDLPLQLKMGDELAFQKLYEAYSSTLYGVLLAIVHNATDAENLLQDVFVKIWINIQSYDSEKGSLYTWMLNICRNVGIDFTRSKVYKQAKKNQDLENFVYTEYRELGKTEQIPETMDIHKALAVLPQSCKHILDLIYFKGYTQQDIADEFSIPLGTVKTRTRIALRELRTYFNL